MVEMESAMMTHEQRQPKLYAIANDPGVIFFMPKSNARRYSNEEEALELDEFKLNLMTHHNQYDHVAWAHKNLDGVLVHKLRKYFTNTLDQNADGVINWHDFEIAIEGIVPKADAEGDSRIGQLRRCLERDFRKYWADLCEKGDINLDGNVDQEEWFDVMDGIVGHLKNNESFPEWYEDFFKVLFHSQDFDNRNAITRDEFIDLLGTLSFEEEPAGRAYDYITQNGSKKLNYELFLDFMKQFHTNDKQGHPVNCGLDL